MGWEGAQVCTGLRFALEGGKRELTQSWSGPKKKGPRNSRDLQLPNKAAAAAALTELIHWSSEREEKEQKEQNVEQSTVGTLLKELLLKGASK